MKLYLEFEPCEECKNIIKVLDNQLVQIQTREEESAKFLRHITYNHSELVQAIVKDLPAQKLREEFRWFQ
ncbi:MAG TPA: hypothetical protein VLD38_05765 [Nitrosopumilaceae archaeon]|nr:hypothetical protein [Nitrosopumilaceae archaeon]